MGKGAVKARAVRTYMVSRTFMRVLIEAVYKLSMEVAEPVTASQAIKIALQRYAEDDTDTTTYDIGGGDTWHVGAEALVVAWTSQDRGMLEQASRRYEARTSGAGTQIEIIAASLTKLLTA